MPILQKAENNATDDKSRTFIFENEGHTLGNALRCIISSNKDVEFCGYTVPHPAENVMHFRIQMRKGRAVDALKKGLDDLVKVCDHTIKVFDEEMLTFKMKQTAMQT